MKIFIIGSNRHLEGEELNEYNHTCNLLGKMLSSMKHTLVCCSNSNSTADYHFMVGLKLSKAKSKLEFYIPFDNTAGSYEDILKSVTDGNNNLETSVHRINGDWRLTHLNAVKSSDLVIALGGGLNGTITTIYACEFLETPIILIPTFGGATNLAWDYFRAKYYSEAESNAFLGFPLAKDKDIWCKSVISAGEGLKVRNPFKSQEKKSLVSSAITSISIMLFWILIFSFGLTLLGGQISIFLLFACASIIGSCGRFIFSTVLMTHEEWQKVDLVNQIVAGLILGFGFFLFTEVTSFSLNGSALKINDLDTFQRVAITLSLLIFIASLFFEEGFKQLSKKSTQFLTRNKT